MPDSDNARSVEELELSVTAYNLLKDAEIYTIENLVEHSIADLTRIPTRRKVTKRIIKEIEEALSTLHLSLRQSRQQYDWLPQLTLKDWKVILGLPWSRRAAILVKELRKYRNEPLADSYIVTLPLLYNFHIGGMAAFNVVFHRYDLPYTLRYSCIQREADFTVRLYKKVLLP